MPQVDTCIFNRVYNSGDEFGEETNLSNISTEKTSKVLLHIPLKAY